MRNRLLERRVPLAIFAVRQTQQQFKEFNMSLQTMQKMLRDVRGIADQTHLLSLNAAIEAAHAGAVSSRLEAVTLLSEQIASKVEGSYEEAQA